MRNRIRRTCAAALLMLLLIFGAAAAAVETPGIGCFSPGLLRLSALEAENPPVSAQAEFTVDKAMYARDLSVLASMLSGTTFDYSRSGSYEALSILRGEETLTSFALAKTEDGAALTIGPKTYICDEKSALQAMTGLELQGYEKAQIAAQELTGAAVLERVPLDAVAAWLEGLSQGDPLPGGFAVLQPFVLERTMSDDGTRLTRIDVRAGSISRADEAPYVLTGYLRQPAGRAPKDTFELVLTQDEKNYLELSYSALRENEVTRKNKAGTTSVRTSIKAAGKIEGSRISSRLTVTMKNAWTADGEDLNEKITISANLEHQDNRPGMRMLRLNSVTGSMRHVIRLTTNETRNDVISLSDEVTLEVTMDENTFLAGGADVRMRVGGEAGEKHMPTDEAQQATAQEITDAFEEELVRLSASVYPYLSESAKKKIGDGL